MWEYTGVFLAITNHEIPIRDEFRALMPSRSQTSLVLAVPKPEAYPHETIIRTSLTRVEPNNASAS